jgi:hypothetical protein
VVRKLFGTKCQSPEWDSNPRLETVNLKPQPLVQGCFVICCRIAGEKIQPYLLVAENNNTIITVILTSNHEIPSIEYLLKDISCV